MCFEDVYSMSANFKILKNTHLISFSKVNMFDNTEISQIDQQVKECNKNKNKS